jgi:hypothetical protein
VNTRLGRSLLLPLLFVLSLPAVTTRFYASDEIEFFAWLRSLTFDRDADFDNEYRYFYDSGAARNALFHETFLERVNENGRRINFTPIGCALLWAPFYGAGHLVARVTGAPADGFSHPYIAAVAYGSAVYGALALALSAAIARRFAGRGAAAAFAVLLGTPLIFYMYVAPGFSHACSAFAVAVFLWVWLRIRDRWTMGGAALLGLTGALMAMVREQDVFFIAGPAIDIVWRAVAGMRQGRPWPAPTLARAAIAGTAAFLLAYTPQLLAYDALHGHPGPSDMVGRKMNWSSPHALGVLFSPEHGWLAWTPLVLLAMAGLVLLASGRTRDAAAADARWLGAMMLVMTVLQCYVAGAVESWTVSGSFGQRRFLALTPLLVVGLAVLFARAAGSSGRRWLLGTLVAVCIWWNLGLLVQFSLHEMDRERLTLRQNAYTTFVALPRRAPGILWQYLTNRSSFYGRPRQ